VGLSATHISPGFTGLHFDEIKHYYKCNGDPGLCLQSSQVSTLPKAKSKTRSKQNQDMHKCSSLYSEQSSLFLKPNEIFIVIEKLLIANGAELIRIGGGVEGAKYSRKMEISR
jgi:hypothetical protein